MTNTKQPRVVMHINPLAKAWDEYELRVCAGESAEARMYQKMAYYEGVTTALRAFSEKPDIQDAFRSEIERFHSELLQLLAQGKTKSS